jgi:hypothetical protein
MNTLFIAWQDPKGRSWAPIGRLTYDEGHYEFAYLKGAELAQKTSGFEALTSFPDLTKVYRSDELFPIFSNRLPSPSRPDYSEFVEWLNIPQGQADPIAVLSRSGGRRVTDSLEVFPNPEPDASGNFSIHFFAHGLRYLPKESVERIDHLREGERLLLCYDFQNPHDPKALILRTNDAYPGDRHIVGYCPRYLLEDAFKVLEEEHGLSEVAVERVNLPPAPLQVRLLCRLKARWPSGFRPFSTGNFKLITSQSEKNLLKRVKAMRHRNH